MMAVAARLGIVDAECLRLSERLIRRAGSVRGQLQVRADPV
jgi:hypothetical protein